MPDVSIGSAGHQASFGRVGTDMVTAPAECDSRPKEEQMCDHLNRDDEWGVREQGPHHQQTQQSTDHAKVANDGEGLQHVGGLVIGSGEPFFAYAAHLPTTPHGSTFASPLIGSPISPVLIAPPLLANKSPSKLLMTIGERPDV